MARPVVAIIGRPNVGKSTLFNRLVGERIAIVEDLPGTTRDRIYATADWRGREFSLVDTGGLEDPKVGLMEAAVRRQAENAIDEADVILFLVDAKTGILPVEYEVADRLRRTRTPVLIAANKSDGWRSEAQAAEFYALGLGEVHVVSAIQGHGSGDLLDAIVAVLPEPETDVETGAPRVAIVGRPNVGKSSFLNALAGGDRAVVSDVPGTTRDSIDSTIEWNGAPVVLVDTAGIRRAGKVGEGIEKYALLRTIRALERSDVAILLLDATEGITAQDTHVAGYALEASVGLVLAMNKWDAVDRGEDTTARVEALIEREFHFAPWVDHHFISAKHHRNVEETLADAIGVVGRRAARVPTSDLHTMLVEAIADHPPPLSRGNTVRFHHVTQAHNTTPTFVFFVDRPDAVHFSYTRYLENRIRETFGGFRGTPIKIELRNARE